MDIYGAIALVDNCLFVLKCIDLRQKTSKANLRAPMVVAIVQFLITVLRAAGRWVRIDTPSPRPPSPTQWREEPGPGRIPIELVNNMVRDL